MVIMMTMTMTMTMMVMVMVMVMVVVMMVMMVMVVMVGVRRHVVIVAMMIFTLLNLTQNDESYSLTVKKEAQNGLTPDLGIS